MQYFTDDFLYHRRKSWLRSLTAAEVLVGSSWHRGEIIKKEITSSSIKLIATISTINELECTITASRIIDIRGEVAATQFRTISKAKSQGTMIQIEIPIQEVQIQ